MLEVAFKDSPEGASIQTKQSVDLFNVAHLKAKTNASQKIRRQMIFADSVLVAHDTETMQRLVNKLSSAAKQFSLKINIKQIERLFQLVKNQDVMQPPSNIVIHDEALVQIKELCIC